MTQMRHLPTRSTIFSLNRPQALGLGVCMLLGTAALDYATSYEFSIAAFYLFAILTVAWNCGARWGLVFAALALISQLALGLLRGHPFSTPLYFYNAEANVLLEYCVAIFLTAQLRQRYDRERYSARIDLLTGVKNRQGFQEVLEGEIARHHRNGASFCLAYIDCDDFKGVNDRFGHSEGDRLLEAVGYVTAASIRRGDTVGRLGGDEFAVIFPETHHGEALAIEAKLREALTTITRPRPWWAVTFSIGIATFERMPASADTAMAFVDHLMYQAKNAGKAHTISGVYDDSALPADSAGIIALRRLPRRARTH